MYIPAVRTFLRSELGICWLFYCYCARYKYCNTVPVRSCFASARGVGCYLDSRTVLVRILVYFEYNCTLYQSCRRISWHRVWEPVYVPFRADRALICVASTSQSVWIPSLGCFRMSTILPWSLPGTVVPLIKAFNFTKSIYLESWIGSKRGHARAPGSREVGTGYWLLYYTGVLDTSTGSKVLVPVIRICHT